jgi:hypothetical protein
MFLQISGQSFSFGILPTNCNPFAGGKLLAVLDSDIAPRFGGSLPHRKHQPAALPFFANCRQLLNYLPKVYSSYFRKLLHSRLKFCRFKYCRFLTKILQLSMFCTASNNHV